MADSAENDITEDIIKLLSDPAIYGDQSEKVKLIETHMSRVFLSRTFALKLKKPVRFEFADFSTVEARRAACEEELRLNRLWSHDVYLNVVPVTRRERGQLALGGSGPPVDWLVKMRRLSEKTNLARMIHDAHLLAPAEEKSLAQYLVSCYEKLPPTTLKAADYVRRFAQHQNANTHDLLALVGGNERQRVLRIHNALARFLWLERHVLEQRVKARRVVDGHGDLRPEHVYMDSPPQIIDGIEFAREFRENDVLDELCFFAMECEELGASGLAATVLSVYGERFGSDASSELMNFYKAYRAVVRAKVHALRAEQAPAGDKPSYIGKVRSYIAHADDYSRPIVRPFMIVVGGLMGTGKSTLAKVLAEATGSELLQTDEIRRKMFGKSDSPAAYGQENYRQDRRRAVYQQMFVDAAAMLDDRRSVVLDGTFLTNEVRTKAEQCARSRSVQLLFAWCQAPAATVRERLARRLAAGQTHSEARPELYDSQASELEPFPERLATIAVDTTEHVNRQLARVRTALRPVARSG